MSLSSIEALGVELPKTREYERVASMPTWGKGVRAIAVGVERADAMRDELLAVIERLAGERGEWLDREVGLCRDKMDLVAQNRQQAADLAAEKDANCLAIMEERDTISELRADLAAMTKERDELQAKLDAPPHPMDPFLRAERAEADKLKLEESNYNLRLDLAAMTKERDEAQELLDDLDSYNGHLAWMDKHYPLDVTYFAEGADIGCQVMRLSRKVMESERELTAAREDIAFRDERITSLVDGGQRLLGQLDAAREEIGKRDYSIKLLLLARYQPAEDSGEWACPPEKRYQTTEDKP